MLTARANYHHSKLPQPGAIGYIHGLSTVNPRRKCVVESYPLCDGAIWTNPRTKKPVVLSYGIHTVNVRFLDTGQVARFSGFYFKEPGDF